MAAFRSPPLDRAMEEAQSARMTGHLSFGLLLHTRRLIEDDGSADFSPLWDAAQRAEAAGYDDIWLGDSITTLDRARGDCLTLMAALGMATRRVRIGTVPLLMSLRHPVPLAHALASIDVIAQGRLRIAASPGPVVPYMARQFEACGVPAGEKAGRLGETIVLCRRLWTEERVTFAGKYFRLEREGVLPKPAQKPAIPVWIATSGRQAEPALRRVARLADGWVSTDRTPESFAASRAAIDRLAGEYGRERGAIGPSILFAAVRIGAESERAHAAGWDWMERFFRRPRADLEATYTPIFGTVEDCAALLARFREAGMTGVIARIASDDVAKQTELLLEGVRPMLGA